MKKTLSVIISIVLTLSLFNVFIPITVSSDVWDGTAASRFQSGSGKYSDPYIISTPQQLKYLANSIKNGTKYDGKYIKLENTIILNDEVFDFMPDSGLVRVTDGINTAYLGTGYPGLDYGKSTVFDDTPSIKGRWYKSEFSTELGSYAGDIYLWEPCKFSGNFDGAGFYIKGLYCNQDSSNVGLFSIVHNSLIQNLNITDSLVIGNSNVGGIAGQQDCDKIEQASDIIGCHNGGIVCGSAAVGGIVGYMNRDCADSADSVSDSSNTGDIIAVKNCGGIVGSFIADYSAYSIDNQIVGNYNAGNIYCKSQNCGGIAGQLQAKCFGGTGKTITTRVKYCYNTGTLWGESQVGGIVGYAYASVGGTSKGSAYTVINSTYNLGSINAQSYKGEIIGLQENKGSYADMQTRMIAENLVTDSYYESIVAGYNHVGAYNSGMQLARFLESIGTNYFEFAGQEYGYYYPTLKKVKHYSRAFDPYKKVALLGNCEYGSRLEVSFDDGVKLYEQATYAFQWYIDDIAIQGATSRYYTLKKSDIGKYIQVRIKANGNFFGKIESEHFLITKPVPSTPGLPTLESKTDYTVTLTATDGYLYKCNDGEWQASPTFTELLPNTAYTFYQKVAETSDNCESESSEGLTVTTKSTGEAPDKPTVIDITDTTVTLKLVNGCEYCYNKGKWQNSNTFTGLSPNTEYIFYQRIAETDTIYVSEISEGLSVKTLKSSVSPPEYPHYVTHTLHSVTVYSNSQLEYSIDKNNWQDSPSFDGLLENTIYKIYARFKETETSCASEPSEPLTVSIPGEPIIRCSSNEVLSLIPVEGYEYSLDKLTWQSSPTFQNLISGTEYNVYQRLMLIPGTNAEQIVSSPKQYVVGISPSGHEYEETIVKPTCIAAGFTEHTCKYCNNKYDDNYTDFIDHTCIIDKSISPTCTNSGLTEGSHCVVCNAVLVPQSHISALGHNFVNNKCTRCGFVKKDFKDVMENTWYSTAVIYTVGTGLIKGYSNGLFGTSDDILRQDYIVILSRHSGDDLSNYKNHSSFTDVSINAYYSTALSWAKSTGVSSGYANGNFGVGDKVTREQIMTFLYNYAKKKGIDVTVSDAEKSRIRSKYSDFDSISPYAVNATYWALSRGIISGKDLNDGTKLIAPKSNALRCEVATMFYNIDQKGVLK